MCYGGCFLSRNEILVLPIPIGGMQRRTLITVIGLSATTVSGCIENVNPSGESVNNSPTDELTSSDAGTVSDSYGLDPGTVSDLWLVNKTKNRISLTVTATRNNENVYEERFELNSENENGSEREEEDITDEQKVTVTVDVDEGPTNSHEFDDNPTSTQGLLIELHENSIIFQEHAA